MIQSSCRALLRHNVKGATASLAVAALLIALVLPLVPPEAGAAMVQPHPEVLMDIGSGPVAMTDTATLEEWSSVVISVLDNDIAGAFALVTDSVAISTEPSRGSVVWNGPGKYTYTPISYFHGADWFAYIVCDSSGACVYGHVDVMVSNVEDPVAVTDTASTIEATPVHVSVLDNDLPGRYPLVADSVAVSIPSEHGSAVWTVPGEITFTPAPTFTGQTSFQYLICDTMGQCGYGVVVVSVEPGVRMSAVDDVTTTIENTAIEIDVLANDSPGVYPPDLESLTITEYPDLGWAEVLPTGRIRFVPRAGLLGADGFTYFVCDPYGFCSQANVTVTVLDDDIPSPVAVPDLVTTDELVTVRFNVASNDLPGALPIDPDSVEIANRPLHGSAIVAGQGEVTYTPAPGFIGEDAFGYVICEIGGLQCAVGAVLVTVEDAADPGPITDLVTAVESVPLSFNVLDNDVSGDYPLVTDSVSISRVPAHGFVEMTMPGEITYTALLGYSGIDTIEYTLCDSIGQCAYGQVLVTVLNAADPVAVTDTVIVTENVPHKIRVLDNDIAGDYPLVSDSVAVSAFPSHGSVDWTIPGEITYTAMLGYAGVDSFEYIVCDTLGQCAYGQVLVTVLNAADPVAVTDTAIVTENVPWKIKVMYNDLAGDYPLVSDSVAVSAIPSHGSAVPSTPGEITYRAMLGYAGADSFEYIVCDTLGQCAYGQVLVTVLDAANPTAVTDTAIATENSAQKIKVMYNDLASDYPLVSDSVAVSVFPSHGSVDWTIPGEITYTPSPGYVGQDSFEYIVCDSIGQCAYAPVFVTVTPAGGPTVIIGEVTNGGNARVSVFSATSGAQVATAFMSDGHFSIEVPPAACPSGYKIYFTAPSGLMPVWYKGGQNFSDANCTDAPAVLDNVTLLPSVQFTGSVKDLATNADLDGSIVYAFSAADGRFVGWSRAGSAGPGRYSIPVVAGTTYKLKVQPPTGYLPEWNGGAHSFVTAGELTPPSDVYFFVRSTGSISGGVKRSDGTPVTGAQIYAWDSTTGSFAGSAATGGGTGGDFAINLDPSKTYKVKTVGPSGLEDRWYPSAPGWAEAIGVAPPFSLEMELRDAVQISGVAAMPNQPTLVSAYTNCGCTSPTNTISDIFGNYSLKVVSTSLSGDQYRIRAIDSAGTVIWYNGSPGFTGSTPVSAPASGIDLTS